MRLEALDKELEQLRKGAVLGGSTAAIQPGIYDANAATGPANTSIAGAQPNRSLQALLGQALAAPAAAATDPAMDTSSAQTSSDDADAADAERQPDKDGSSRSMEELGAGVTGVSSQAHDVIRRDSEQAAREAAATCSLQQLAGLNADVHKAAAHMQQADHQQQPGDPDATGTAPFRQAAMLSLEQGLRRQVQDVRSVVEGLTGGFGAVKDTLAQLQQDMHSSKVQQNMLSSSNQQPAQSSVRSRGGHQHMHAASSATQSSQMQQPQAQHHSQEQACRRQQLPAHSASPASWTAIATTAPPLPQGTCHGSEFRQFGRASSRAVHADVSWDDTAAIDIERSTSHRGLAAALPQPSLQRLGDVSMSYRDTKRDTSSTAQHHVGFDRDVAGALVGYEVTTAVSLPAKRTSSKRGELVRVEHTNKGLPRQCSPASGHSHSRAAGKAAGACGSGAMRRRQLQRDQLSPGEVSAVLGMLDELAS